MLTTSDLERNTKEQERLLEELTEGHPERKQLVRQLKSFAVDVPSIIDVMKHIKTKTVTAYYTGQETEQR
ncbi:hypothetical protein [Alicyclobacillus sp. SO9]|uniref:hypothetical protein n=1 Tax=Alicyclobacillus sp. SO9 TaxID=2665646 RepID=UPI0018E80AD3|nr:hypothetical protein [Alicyclobacillus sp. SO9]QQE78447.1 hypothetical protein GI364_21655 [Alicyclobacillus sp. SO9]